MPPAILLVDDEPKLTTALKHTLFKENYKIFTAGTASEALGILSREHIDVVVSDERMPGMSGSELLTIVCRKYPHTIRIMLTGQASSEAAMRAINEGQVYRFLTKPCNGLDLVITIRRALQYLELFRKSQQLLSSLRKESTLLKILENTHPEVIKTLNNPGGTMSIENPADHYEELIVMINNEIRHSENLIQQITSMDPTHLPESSPSPAPAASSTQNTRDPQETQTEGLSNQVTPSGTNPQTSSDVTSDTSQENTSDPEYLEGVNNLKDLKPIMSRSAIKEILDECNELKGLSPTVARVLKLTRQSNCSIEQVAKVVKQDHAISLKILKMANSVVYTRGEPVDTIQKAVMRIGMTQIRQAVLNISVIEQFSSNEHDQHISTPQFWEHSIATGMIAALLTRMTDGKEQQIDAAFTMGLLHDIGRVVYLEMLGDKYINVFKAAQALQLPLEQVESRMLLVNHADAMDRILHQWNFAKELVNPIALHQLSLGNIRRMAPRTLNEVAILALANRLAHALLLGSSGNLALYPTEEFAPALSLKAGMFHTIEEEIPGQTDDVKFSLLAHSNQQSWPRLRDELSEQMHLPFRPLFLSMDPDFDSLRIFCNRLRDTSEEGLPNIAIIHIKAGGERVPLTTKFKKAELDAGCALQPLPLVIISPKGDITLEERFMAERQSVQLSFPFAISKIINAFNTLTASVAVPTGA
ncbi:MAG: HDOD domain-containing protein [Sedimentisphaerales bacterium]|nr:HDOD domain-containing protein [Sedimentisphaerales bacterium]